MIYSVVCYYSRGHLKESPRGDHLCVFLPPFGKIGCVETKAFRAECLCEALDNSAAGKDESSNGHCIVTVDACHMWWAPLPASSTDRMIFYAVRRNFGEDRSESITLRGKLSILPASFWSLPAIIQIVFPTVTITAPVW